MPVRQVADGMLADVKPKPSPASVAASVRSVLDMITKAATPVTKTMTDTPPVRATYKMRMNKYTSASRSLEMLKSNTGQYVNADADPYYALTAEGGRNLFRSKYVPMTDDTTLLHDFDKKTMSQRGYGNVPDCKLQTVSQTMRIGFNNTLTDTTGGKIVACVAPVIHHFNNAVKTDFPKGPGGSHANQLFEDGTYEMMFDKVSKEFPAIPEKLKFKAPTDRRRKIFNLQAMTGAEVFGDAMLKKTLQDSFAEDRLAELKTAARRALPTATEAEIEEVAQGLRVARRQQEIARKLKLSETHPLVRAAADVEVRAEQQAKQEAGAIAGNLAEQAEERAALGVARLKEGRRARLAPRVVRIGAEAVARRQVGEARFAIGEKFRDTLSEQLRKGPGVRSLYSPPVEARGGAGGAFVIEAPEGLSAARISKDPLAGKRGKGRPLVSLSPEERAGAKDLEKARAVERSRQKRAKDSGQFEEAVRRGLGEAAEELFSSSSSAPGGKKPVRR